MSHLLVEIMFFHQNNIDKLVSTCKKIYKNLTQEMQLNIQNKDSEIL